MANLNKFSPDYVGINNGDAYWGLVIDNLNYPANQYTAFTFTFALNNYPNDKYTFVWDNGYFADSGLNSRYGTGKWEHFYTTFNSNNWFTMTAGALVPNTNYRCNAEAYYNGTWYTMSNTQTTWTPDITRPSGSYYPSFEPAVRDQWVYFNGSYHGEAGSCVANALASACEIFENKERSWSNIYFSNVYIYGNTNNSDSGLWISDAISQLKTYGTPRWDRVPGTHDRWSDNRHKTNYSESNGSYLGSGTGAMNIVDNAGTSLSCQALCQRISGNSSNNLNFYDSETIANYIRKYGCVIIGLGVPSTFDDAFSGITDGYVDNPIASYSRIGHAVLLVGWKTVNNVKCWIALNGWGSNDGDYGWCYIPMDWGANSHAPNYSGIVQIYNKWVYDVFQIGNSTLNTYPSTPNAPTGTGRTDSGSSAGLNLTWNYTNYSEHYRVKYVNSVGTYYNDDPNDLGLNTVSLTGLLYGTTYTISVQGRNYFGNGDFSSASLYTTAPKIPTLTATVYTGNSINVSVGVSAGNWSKVTVWYRIGTGAWSSRDITYPNTTATISGLTTGQTYELKASSFYNSIESLNYSSSIYVQVGYARPSNWAWSVSIGASGYNGLVVDSANNRIKVLTAAEMNNFKDKINAFRLYKGLSASNIANVSQYQSATAAYANSLRSAILAMSPPTTLPAAVSAGGTITATFLNGLRNSLNSIL